MDPWHERWRHWEGTAEELVEAVSRIVGEEVPDEEFAPNVRLLRHYQSIGAVTRPERRGKEAIYGYRQLLEVMAVRTLVLDGWPLAKIAELTSAATEGELIDLLPRGRRRRERASRAARDLVARFARESDVDIDMDMAEELGAADASPHEDTPAYRAVSRASRPGPDRADALRELIELEPMRGVRVTVAREDLQRLGARDIRALGDAVERALTEARRRVRGGTDDD